MRKGVCDEHHTKNAAREFRLNYLTKVMTKARVDRPANGPQPTADQFLLAAVLSVIGSLVICAIIVRVTTVWTSSLKSFGSFHFDDYGTLTVVGVLAASASWPIVTRISLFPKRLFLRLAVVVTAVLWVPDIYILTRHEPPRAIIALMVMHLAIAAVTYNCLVRIAAPRERVDTANRRERAQSALRSVEVTVGASETKADDDRWLEVLSTCLAALVGVEFLLGMLTLFALQTGRPSGWLPRTGDAVYLAHGIVGLPLGLGALALVSLVRRSSRLLWACAWCGAIGVAIAGFGGLLTTVHALRTWGMSLMALGSLLASISYVTPLIQRVAEESPPTQWSPRSK